MARLGQAGEGRLHGLDALRGLAIFGILLINIQVFSGYGFLGEEGRTRLSGADRDADLSYWLDLLVQERFYSLFSLLFGYSFYMLASRLHGRGLSIHLRRMLGLVVIGLLHSLLLWPWDILLLYGVVGLLLAVFLNRSTASLFVASLVVLLLTVLIRWFGPAMGFPTGRFPESLALIQEYVPSFRQGHYGEVVVANVYLSYAVLLDWVEGLRPLRVLMLFLLGASAASLQLARPGAGGLRYLVVSAVIGLLGGLGLGLVEQSPDGHSEPVVLLAEVLAAPLLALGYGAVLILWWRGGHLPSRLTAALLAPVGRMALTNYLLQSAVFVPLFYGFGLGLFGRYRLDELLWMVAGFFLLQVLFSALWLACFRQGPLEWLWRWQVRGSRPPFLK